MWKNKISRNKIGRINAIPMPSLQDKLIHKKSIIDWRVIKNIFQALPCSK